jgi:hypothetical protein
MLSLSFMFPILSLPLVAQSDQCNDVLKDGIFDVSHYNSDSQYRNTLDSWFYESDFQTHQQAADAGLSLGFPVYGVPIKIGGTFDQNQVDSWKKEHAGSVKTGLSYNDSRSAALQLVNKQLVDAWSRCIVEKNRALANQYGLYGGLQLVGRDYIYVWLQYKPSVIGSAKILAFQANGVDVPSSPPIASGRIIGPEIESVGATYRIVDRNNLSFAVQAVDAQSNDPRGSLVLTFDSSKFQDDLQKLQADKNVIASTAFLVGEVRIFAFGGEPTASQVAPLRAMGWMECAGQDLNVLQYPELYAVLGQTWGSSAPGVSFNAPDFRGLFLRGWNHAQNNPAKADPDIASRGGGGPQGTGATKNAVGSLQPDAFQNHQHDLGQFTYRGDAQTGGHTGARMNQPPASDVSGGATTGNAAAETRPKNVYVMYLIYVGRPILVDTP